MIDTTELVRELVYQLRLGEDSAYEFKLVEFERRGEGVPKILSASKALSLQKPKYEQPDEAGAELKLTIYAASKELNGLVGQFEERS